MSSLSLTFCRCGAISLWIDDINVDTFCNMVIFDDLFPYYIIVRYSLCQNIERPK